MQTKLYTDFSHLYDAMYPTFINYDEEYRLYSTLLEPFQPRKILEIGCGTGRLASKFHQAGYDYTGFDLSESMLQIARQRTPSVSFIQGDMTRLNFENAFDGVLITGRTLSYIIHNKDLISTFKGILKALVPKGVLIFDFIDAHSFFKALDPQQVITHQASYDNQIFKRDSRYALNLETGWTWDWYSSFFKENQSHFEPIGDDKATLRAFLKEEIQTFLELTGFNVLKTIEQKTYAFDTYVLVCGKEPLSIQ